jgi:hypothetical protein
LFQTLPNDELERRGAVVIASNWGTEDPGSNPDRLQSFYENISMLLCIVTKCALFVRFKLEINASAQKYFKRRFSTIDFRLLLEYLRCINLKIWMSRWEWKHYIGLLMKSPKNL